MVGEMRSTLIKESQYGQFELVRPSGSLTTVRTDFSVARFKLVPQNTMKTNKMSYLVCIVHVALLFHLVHGRNEYMKVFAHCATQKSTFDCLKRRALEILDFAIKDDSVYVLNDYVAIGKDPAVSHGSIDRSLKDENETQLSLTQKLDNKFYEYIASRSIKLTIPGTLFKMERKRTKDTVS